MNPIPFWMISVLGCILGWGMAYGIPRVLKDSATYECSFDTYDHRAEAVANNPFAALPWLTWVRRIGIAVIVASIMYTPADLLFFR